MDTLSRIRMRERETRKLLEGEVEALTRRLKVRTALLGELTKRCAELKEALDKAHERLEKYSVLEGMLHGMVGPAVDAAIEELQHKWAQRIILQMEENLERKYGLKPSTGL